MSLLVYEHYSDHDMQCPGDWYGGFKEGRIERFGDAERSLSHIWTGDWTGSTFSLKISDFDRSLREMLASPIDRYWTEPWQIFMTTRANRALLGTPYTVFVGRPIEVQPAPPLSLDVTLGDIIQQSILSDQHQLPWRVIRDCGLFDPAGGTYTFVPSDSVDLDSPEPIIYGVHRRVPNIDPASPQGFEYTPQYLGIETLGSGDWHVWIVCGHAVFDIPDVNMIDPTDGSHQTLIPDEGTDWLFPKHAGHLAEFGTDYRDIRSHTFGVDRRYSMIFGKVGTTNADDCALGTKTLACFVEGVEDYGDGTGLCITDRIDQYRHFVINYVANYGHASYQSGLWLTNPTWDLYAGPVDIVDEFSFDDCKAIAAIRYPAVLGSPATPEGYVGAAVIGAGPGTRASVKKWIADWNRSCSTRNGFTHRGQYRVVMLHPTQLIKDAAPLYTDAYEILKDSFRPDLQWRDQANRVPFKADYEHRTGQWKTSDVADAGDAITYYQREILGEVREYPFAPGITMAYHLARLEALVVKHPPRVVALEATVGPDHLDQSLGYLDLGDYIRYRHFASISSDVAEERLAQIVWHQVQVGKRRVKVLAMDCEDLIDYDAFDATGDPTPQGNFTCADAIVVTPEDPIPTRYRIDIDTTLHPTDAGVTLATGPGIAYHAGWWSFTPLLDGEINISAILSEYDTQLAVFTGTCGALTEIDYNDNVLGLQTSSIGPLAVVTGTTYYILACGYGPTDGGLLKLDISFDSPSLP